MLDSNDKDVALYVASAGDANDREDVEQDIEDIATMNPPVHQEAIHHSNTKVPQCANQEVHASGQYKTGHRKPVDTSQASRGPLPVV